MSRVGFVSVFGCWHSDEGNMSPSVFVMERNLLLCIGSSTRRIFSGPLRCQVQSSGSQVRKCEWVVEIHRSLTWAQCMLLQPLWCFKLFVHRPSLQSTMAATCLRLKCYSERTCNTSQLTCQDPCRVVISRHHARQEVNINVPHTSKT